jgi:hypothetical protein
MTCVGLILTLIVGGLDAGPPATVRVRLTDGSKLELSEFRLMSGHHGSHSQFYTPSGKQRSERDIPVALGGQRWRLVAVRDLRELVLSASPRDSGWLAAEGTLASGETISGQIPADIKSTWVDGDGFEVWGKSTVLGKEGDFDLHIGEVKRITRAPDTQKAFLVESAKGVSVIVRQLAFGDYWTPPTLHCDEYLEVDDRGPAGGTAITVRLGNTEVDLKRADLLTVEFGENKTVTVQTTTGEKATGTLVSDVTRAYGKLGQRELWFGPIGEIRALEFKSAAGKGAVRK